MRIPIAICLTACIACEDVDTDKTVLANNVLYENTTTSTLESATVQDALDDLSLTLDATLIGEWRTECWDVTTTDLDSPGQGLLTVTALDDVVHSGVCCLARTNSDGGGIGGFQLNSFKPLGNRAVLTALTATTGDGVQTHLVLELTKNRIVLAVQNDGIEILTRIEE